MLRTIRTGKKIENLIAKAEQKTRSYQPDTKMCFVAQKIISDIFGLFTSFPLHYSTYCSARAILYFDPEVDWSLDRQIQFFTPQFPLGSTFKNQHVLLWWHVSSWIFRFFSQYQYMYSVSGLDHFGLGKNDWNPRFFIQITEVFLKTKFA